MNQLYGTTRVYTKEMKMLIDNLEMKLQGWIFKENHFLLVKADNVTKIVAFRNEEITGMVAAIEQNS